MINEDNEEEDNLSTLKSVSVIEVGRSLQVASCPALRGRLASHLDTSNISYMIILSSHLISSCLLAKYYCEYIALMFLQKYRTANYRV